MRTDRVTLDPCRSHREPSPRRFLRAATRTVRSTALPILILAGIATTSTEVMAGAVYILNDNNDIANYQNGFHVTGTITTNGATGLLDPTKAFTDWDITVRSPDNFTTIAHLTKNGRDASSVSAPQTGVTGGTGGVVVTPTDINIGTFIGESLAFNQPRNATATRPPTFQIEWLSTFPIQIGDQQPLPMVYQASNQTTATIYWNTSPPPQDSIATFAFATAPEPSSLGMLGTAISAGLAYGWYRHRREQRRQCPKAPPDATE